MPGALVDGVVDRDDGGHVGFGGGEGFAAHGVEEHAFGGVDPIPCGFVGGGVALAVCGSHGTRVWLWRGG